MFAITYALSVSLVIKDQKQQTTHGLLVNQSINLQN